MNPEVQLAAPSQTPIVYEGFTVGTIFGLLNIVVGLMLVAAFLSFFGGLTGYLARLGLESRKQGLYAMYMGVTILFVLIVLLAIVRGIQYHSQIFYFILAIAVLIFISWVAFTAFSAPAEEE